MTFQVHNVGKLFKKVSLDFSVKLQCLFCIHQVTKEVSREI